MSDAVSRSEAPAVRLEVLDFLRGIAALVVLINHTRGRFFAGGGVVLSRPEAGWLDYAAVSLLQLTSLGTAFVIVFFVVSGFSMANSVRYSSSVSLFYLKRVIRIWPPYLAAVLLAFALGSATGVLPFDAGRLAAMLVYVRTSTPLTPQFWSLVYEVLFYLLCPLLLAGERRVQVMAAAATVLMVATVAVAGVMLNPFGRNIPLNFLGNELFFFAMGALAYHRLAAIPRLDAPWLVVVCIAAFGAAWAAKKVFGDSNMVSNMVMIVATVLAIRNLPSSWATVRPLNLGYFSYSIYIFHFALIGTIAVLLRRQFGVVQADMTSYWLWVIAVPPVLGLCWLLYWVTERPCNQAVARIRRRDHSPKSVSGP